jgi:hypothetical protein
MIHPGQRIAKGISAAFGLFLFKQFPEISLPLKGIPSY